MIIPIKCFTCGKVLADKYNYFLKTRQRDQRKERVEYPKSYLFNRNKYCEDARRYCYG